MKDLLPAVDRVLAHAECEHEAEPEESESLLRIREIRVVVASVLLVSFGKSLPGAAGVFLAVEFHEMGNDGEKDAALHVERLIQTIPDVDDHLRVLRHLRRAEDVGHLRRIVGELGEIEPPI